MTESLDLTVIRRQHALGYGQCHVDELLAEVERLRDEIADAREACPHIRMQDHFDAPLLKLVNLEVSRGFNRDAEIARLAEALASASASPSSETIEVIVNGQPVIVKSGTVRDVISQAVRLSGQIGAPIAQWQLRTTEGDVIPHDLSDGTDYELTPGRRLWLNLGPPVHLPASASPHPEKENL